MVIGKAAFFTNTDGREGALEDKRNLETIFWTYLGFEPLTGNEKESSVENLNKKEWPDWVSKIKNTNFSQCKYVLLAFSSHGQEAISKRNVREPVLNLNNEQQLYQSEILEALSEKNNPTLKDKPKIIMLISCRYFLLDVDKFQPGLPKFDPSKTVESLGKPEELTIEGITDQEIRLKCKKQTDVKKYQVQYSLRDSLHIWKIADTKEENNTLLWTHITVLKLEKNTEYCLAIRGIHINDSYGPFIKVYERTLEPEDEGVPVNEIVESDPSPRASGPGCTYSDGLFDGLLGKKKKDVSPDNDTNTSAQPDFHSQGDIESIHKLSNSKSRFAVSKVDESKGIQPFEEFRECFSADHIPNDFLIVYGTTRGGASKRNSVKGSWVIHLLKEVILNEPEDVELNFFHILTKAAQKMSNKSSVDNENNTQSGKKSIMCFSHTLTEQISVMKKKKELKQPDLDADSSNLTDLAKKLDIK